MVPSCIRIGTDLYSYSREYPLVMGPYMAAAVGFVKGLLEYYYYEYDGCTTENMLFPPSYELSLTGLVALASVSSTIFSTLKSLSPTGKGKTSHDIQCTYDPSRP